LLILEGHFRPLAVRSSSPPLFLNPLLNTPSRTTGPTPQSTYPSIIVQPLLGVPPAPATPARVRAPLCLPLFSPSETATALPPFTSISADAVSLFSLHSMKSPVSPLLFPFPVFFSPAQPSAGHGQISVRSPPLLIVVHYDSVISLPRAAFPDRGSLVVPSGSRLRYSNSELGRPDLSTSIELLLLLPRTPSNSNGALFFSVSLWIGARFTPLACLPPVPSLFP